MERTIFSQAIACLNKGGIIVYPTDTLYGIGADIFNEDAVTQVYKIKKRPFTKPLSVAVSCVEDIKDVAILDDKAFTLAKKFLPGSLTLILKRKDIVSDLVTAGYDKLAVRIPKNDVCLKLTSVYGPITCTSANIHGKKTPSNVSDISKQFEGENISLYIDYGKLDNQASTIVDTTEEQIRIVREGAISKKQVLGALENGR